MKFEEYLLASLAPKEAALDFEVLRPTRKDLLWQLPSVLHMRVCRKGKKPVLGRFRGAT